MRRAAASATLALVAAFAMPAAAADGQANGDNALSELTAVEREAPSVDQAILKAGGDALTVEQRLANGELLYRAKDYSRAGLVLSEIVEKYPNTPSAADAQWLRGETYYESKEYLSARRDYKRLSEQSGDRYTGQYVARALARQVDIALRVDDLKALDDVLPRLDALGAGNDPLIQYAKGKALYFKRDYGRAGQSFSAVPAGTQYGHQARYFQALIAFQTARGQAVAAAVPGATDPNGATGPAPRPSPANFKLAIEGFRQVVELPPDTPDHRHVIDIGWMAIARLFTEMEQYEQAAEAYGRVSRESPEFDTMLYELAWVYVKQGDVQRAERALEVLSVSNPNSEYLANGTLVRADLLLRSGAFDSALKLYESVREKYTPMRNQVEAFMGRTTDNSAYYDKLSQRDLDALEQDDQLPPLAVQWAREYGEGRRAFAVLDDVVLSKTLLRKSNELIARLNTMITSSNRVKLFPELMAGEERAVGLINRISRARYEVARGLDETERRDLSGEIADVRAKRQQLMSTIATLPMNMADFDAREQTGIRRWELVSQRLNEQNLEIDRLMAVVNGLRRWMRDEATRGPASDPAKAAKLQAEIEENEKSLRTYQTNAAQLREQVEFSRLQVGFGDARYQEDAARRPDFRDLVEREVQLAAAGQAGGDAQRFAQRMSPSLAQARALEDRLAAAFFALDARVQSKTVELKGKVDEEQTKVVGYAQNLDVLDKEARDVVGEVAHTNFEFVRKRFQQIVLRADIGITEQAWEVRTDELDRLRSLQTERARQEQVLDEELREVLDDAGEQTPSGAGAK